MNFCKSKKGITLIALVIAIILALILLTVSIRLAISGNLFNYAKQAKIETENALNNDKELASKFDNDEYVSSFLYEQRNFTVSSSQTQGSNLWSNTVTINVDFEDQPELTLDQKKAIAAFLVDVPSYDSLSLIKPAAMTDEEFSDSIIELFKKFVDYSNIGKIENLGIKVASIQTPYGQTVYTTNISDPVKCTLHENGNYTFKIKSGGTTKNETITVSNIRTAANSAPYSVKVNFLQVDGYDRNILYATDNNTNFNTLTSETVITCNSKIKFKFDGEKPSGTESHSIHYVEKDDNYYSYYNDDNYFEWPYSLRCGYIYNGVFFYSAHDSNYISSKYFILNAILSNPSYTNLLTSAPPRIYSFTDEIFAKYYDENSSYIHNIVNAKIVGNNINYPADMVSKYPEFSIGNDSVLVWRESGPEESPIYTLNVAHDMSLAIYREGWD